ncbi:MAG: stage III sporulation protein AB [Clostridia bacterium]|nr:stage III sporulation protein AB [Clostridia bacterium]
MKILGCVLVIAISMVIGRLLAESYVDRVKNLSNFITALEMLKSKILFQQEIFEDIFDDISQVCNKVLKGFFTEITEELRNSNIPVSEIWCRKVEEHFPYFDFTYEDEKILLDFGALLGKDDLEGQVRLINSTIERLKGQLMAADAEKNKYAKLYRTIGGIGGTALAVILI